VGRSVVHEQWRDHVLSAIAAVAPQQPVLDRRDQWHPYVTPEISSFKTASGAPLVAWSGQSERLLWDSPSLWAFLKLANAPDDEIVQFAKAWGPLGICVHGKTVMHADGCQLLRWEDCPWLSDEERSRWTDDEAPPEYWEPLAAWRFYARQFAAILVMASELNKGRVPRPEHVVAAFAGPRTYLGPHAVLVGTAFDAPSAQEVLAVAGDWVRYEPQPESHNYEESRLSYWWAVIVNMLNELAHEAGLRFEYRRRAGESIVRLDLALGDGHAPLLRPIPGDSPYVCVGTLFASLVEQLGAAAQRVDLLMRCVTCKVIFESPTGRRPRRDREHVCPECRHKADREYWKENKRRQRERGQAAATATNTLRTCARSGCKKALPTNHARRKYCSDSCRVRAHQEGQKHGRTPTDTPTRTVTSV
jgi:DNA-directed RNA polymerase subunit RPC12/RpoP